MSAPSVPPSKPAAAVSLPRKKKGKWPIFAGIAVVVVIVGLAWYKRSHTPHGIPITTEKAVVRTITQVVTATGKIQPEVEVKITSEDYGEIVELPFDDGAKVKKGDLIVKIKPDLYQAMVDAQSAAVSAAKSAAVHSQASLLKAESDLKRYDDLYRQKLASDSDYTLYKATAAMAQADLLSAQAAVQQAEGALSQARDALSKTLIYSPMDGTVSSRSCEVGERVQGSTEMAGTEIMRVADLGHMEVRVTVNENDIPNVKVGDNVVISIDAYPDRKFSGAVREIGSSAAGAGATGSGSAAQAASTTTGDEVTNFLVKIRVADRDVQLRPGMSATADIQTQTAEHVVAVPIQSVTVRAEGGLTAEEFQEKQDQEDQAKSGNGPSAAAGRKEARRERDLLQKVVFIKTGNKVRLQAVTTGIADNTWIEVKQGVQSGDEVVSGTYAAISRTLKDGVLVQIEAPKKEPLPN
jgi:HlyD family secretion protein